MLLVLLQCCNMLDKHGSKDQEHWAIHSCVMNYGSFNPRFGTEQFQDVDAGCELSPCFNQRDNVVTMTMTML